MSIISLSSADQVDNADFRNFFYKGIKLKPNSQVACVSAVMNYNKELVIDESNDTFNIQVGENSYYNEGFDYKIPHGVYSVAGLVSIINTNVLTTTNVSYLRGSQASGGFSLNFTDTDVPADATKGLNFTVGFTPLQTASNPTCKALDWYGKLDGNATVSFASSADGTTITKSDTHGDDDKYDGIFYTENSLMENQHATFILRKEEGDTWADNTDCPLGVYGIFSSTDFENNIDTQFFTQEKLDKPNYIGAIRPLFGFAIGQDDGGDAVAIEHLESAYNGEYGDGNSYRTIKTQDEAVGTDPGFGTPIIELDPDENVYYIRIWLGQEEGTANTFDNNNAFYFITTAAPNDTFVSTAATWKSWMKFGTKFYPLRVGGGIKQNDSTIAIKMCATDKNLSSGVLTSISRQFNPATWKPEIPYNYSYNTNILNIINTDGTTTGGRPERKLTFFLSVSSQTDEGDADYGNNLEQPNFGNVLGFAPSISSSVLVATGDYSYNNTNFKTGIIDKPYTSAQPSLHIQVSNLPIQSYNGITSSVIRTIAVIPRQRYTGNQGNWTASNLNWININNAEELIMSELDIRITDNANKVIKNLENDTEVVVMFK
jgi:hypothetical protein